MAILLQTFQHTKFNLVDKSYLVNSLGERLSIKKFAWALEEKEYGEVWIDASRWSEDFLGELNDLTRTPWYKTEGEYRFVDGLKDNLGHGPKLEETSFREPFRDMGTLPPIGYYINEELVCWIRRGKYNKSIQRRGYYYNQSFDMHRLEALMHSVVHGSDKRLLSDVGSNPKKTAKTMHAHMHSMNRVLVLLSHDLIITREERDRILGRIDAEGDFNAIDQTKADMARKVSPCGVVNWSGFVGKEELLDVDIKSRMHTLVGQVQEDPRKDIKGYYRPGSNRSKIGVSKVMCKGNITGSQARSLMSQLQLALGDRYVNKLEEFEVNKYADYRSPNINKYPDGTQDEDRHYFSMVFDSLTEDDLFRIIPKLRRLDAWRECWAMVVGERLLNSAGI